MPVMEWILQKSGRENSEETAKEIEAVFIANPYWRVSPKQEQDVRRNLYRILLPVPEVKVDVEVMKITVGQIILVTSKFEG